MTIYSVTIQNTGSDATINNGYGVWLDGVIKISSGRKRLNKADPDNSGDKVKVDTGGQENPRLMMEGVIDWDNTNGTHTVNGLSNCVKATQQLLNKMIDLTQTTDTQLHCKISWGSSSTPRWFRGFNNNTNGFNVAVDSLDFDLISDGHDNHIWVYSLALIEAKEE